MCYCCIYFTCISRHCRFYINLITFSYIRREIQFPGRGFLCTCQTKHKQINRQKITVEILAWFSVCCHATNMHDVMAEIGYYVSYATYNYGTFCSIDKVWLVKFTYEIMHKFIRLFQVRSDMPYFFSNLCLLLNIWATEHFYLI